MELKIGKCKRCATEFAYVTGSPQSQTTEELQYCPLCKEPLFHICAVSIGKIHRDPTRIKTQSVVA